MGRTAGLEYMWCVTAVETNSSLIKVSEYFPEFEFVISFAKSSVLVCRPLEYIFF
jgi:hypothetical protein